MSMYSNVKSSTNANSLPAFVGDNLRQNSFPSFEEDNFGFGSKNLTTGSSKKKRTLPKEFGSKSNSQNPIKKKCIRKKEKKYNLVIPAIKTPKDIDYVKKLLYVKNPPIISRPVRLKISTGSYLIFKNNSVFKRDELLETEKLIYKYVDTVKLKPSKNKRGTYKNFTLGFWYHRGQTQVSKTKWSKQEESKQIEENITGLSGKISEIFARIFPDSIKLLDKYVNKDFRKFGIYTTVTVNVTSISKVHKDDKDSSNVFCCVLPLGNFESSVLTFPDLYKNIELKCGDLIFFASSLLRHGITSVVGEGRLALVFFVPSFFFFYPNDTPKEHK